MTDHAVQASSPAEIVLAVGDEARVDSLLRVAFSRVLQDSRCATTVVCPWMGDGAIEVWVALGMGPSHPFSIHTTLDPKSVEFAGYVVTLLDLMPYPYTTDPIPADEYAVRLRVERLQR